jgi:exonuclease VII small subunit
MIKRQLKFKKYFKQRDEVVSELKNILPNLDNAITLFAKSVQFVKFCSTKVKKTKKKNLNHDFLGSNKTI